MAHRRGVTTTGSPDAPPRRPDPTGLPRVCARRSVTIAETADAPSAAPAAKRCDDRRVALARRRRRPRDARRSPHCFESENAASFRNRGRSSAGWVLGGSRSPISSYAADDEGIGPASHLVRHSPRKTDRRLERGAGRSAPLPGRRPGCRRASACPEPRRARYARLPDHLLFAERPTAAGGETVFAPCSITCSTLGGPMMAATGTAWRSATSRLGGLGGAARLVQQTVRSASMRRAPGEPGRRQLRPRSKNGEV